MTNEKDSLYLTAVEAGGRVHILPDSRHRATGPSKAMTHGTFETGTYSSASQHAPWGERDCLPTDMRRKLLEVPIAMSAIDKMVKMMYGQGIAYYRTSDVEKGLGAKRAYVPEVEEFLRRNRINTHFLLAQFWDFRLYGNTFCEIGLSADRQKIDAFVYQKKVCHA
jgi:hypothetical protein